MKSGEKWYKNFGGVEALESGRCFLLMSVWVGDFCLAEKDCFRKCGDGGESWGMALESGGCFY